MDISVINTKQEELDLATIDGARRFLRAAETVYSEAESYRPDIIGEDGRAVMGEFAPEELYSILSDKKVRVARFVKYVITKLIPQDAKLRSVDVKRAEQTYEEMVVLRNYLRECAAVIKKKAADRLESSQDLKQVVSSVRIEKPVISLSAKTPTEVVANGGPIIPTVEPVTPPPPKLKHKILEIGPDLPARRIPLLVKRPNTVLANGVAGTAVLDTVAYHTQTAGALEKKDPINRVVHHTLPHLPPTDPSLSADSLTVRYLIGQPRYQKFITTNYRSLMAYEKLLDNTITQFESRTVDAIERWLGEEYESAFAFLSGLEVSEVLALSTDRGARAVLQKKGIKYETFAAWVDAIPEMQELVGGDMSLSFGDLYARWFTERKLQENL